MSFRFWFWGAVLSLGVLLGGGCASVGARRAGQPAALFPSDQPREGGLDQSAERTARAHAHFAAGVIHEMNGESEAALQDYDQAALEDPSNEELVLDVSHRLLQNKQPDKALELLSRAAAVPHASGTVLSRLGLVNAELGKKDEAITADREAIRRAPDLLAGYQNIFLLYAQDKHPSEALRVLQSAMAQSKAGAEFLVNLAELCSNFAVQQPELRQKLNGMALKALLRADKLNPDTPSVLLRLADGLSNLDQIDRAAQLYVELLKTLPDLPMIRERIHAKLASIYLRKDDGQHANEQLEAIVREDPTNPQAYYYLGRIAYESKKPAVAADYLRKAILLNPDFQDAYVYLAVAQLGANATSDALATLDQARQKFPGNFDLELWTGLAYSQQKAYPEALRHFTAAEVIAKASDPSRLNHEFYFQLGAASERSGDYAQAAQQFEKSIQLKPDFAEALNYLGYMWAEHGTNLARAKELIEKALKTDPNNAAYLDSLGWVCFQMKQPKEALKYALKAIALSTDPDPTELDHLGDIYALLNQPEKARAAWAKSLQLEPNETVRKKLESSKGPGK